MNYRFRASKSFWRSWSRLSEVQPRAARQAFPIFKANPFDPRLRAHKIHRLSRFGVYDKRSKYNCPPVPPPGWSGGTPVPPWTCPIPIELLETPIFDQPHLFRALHAPPRRLRCGHIAQGARKLKAGRAVRSAPPEVVQFRTADPFLFDVGCWMLDVGCSMFDVRCSSADLPAPRAQLTASLRPVSVLP
jgi:hypothetical protein